MSPTASVPLDPGTGPTRTMTASTSMYIDRYLWVDANSNAKKTANAWRVARPADAMQLDKVASQSVAKWIGNWNTNVQLDVDNATTAAANAGKVPVFVAYNIPQRDCGGLSGGNLTTAQNYRPWIDAFAAGIGYRRAVVILEPDALAQMDCLPASDWQLRYDLIKYAVQAFAAKLNISVYIDAGNPHWKSAQTMSSRLANAGIAQATGFSLNVSNFYTTADNITYGTALSALVSGKHYVIDTSRNGLGPTADFQWCNPAGRALGNLPSTITGNTLVDLFLWVKSPGESDGACNGNPAAGVWNPDYAVGLAQRSAF